ncbi:hypothetical protein KP509_17G077400 [Ceratopteris richardii]|uniref:NAC domain-containing protein n=2 Tax=Ceratopteris richardii TaxID=49495 RepID=A0A8T2SX06_CERRI|nr:hypothetical protein KP509_17G077400 [Ceratopteris richardii]
MRTPTKALHRWIFLGSRQRVYHITGRTFARKVKDPNYTANVQTRCEYCGNEMEKTQLQDWPGLPAGVKFDPGDREILEHLSAKMGLHGRKPHPFIDEFIPTLTEEDGICYTHPENLPGIRHDGTSTHYFHTQTKAYTTGTRKKRKIQCRDYGEIRWHKTGKTRPILENGIRIGFKKIMVLYMSTGKKAKQEKTNWVMHQYHVSVNEEEQGELVVSKVFYQTQPRQAGGKDNVEEEPGEDAEEMADSDQNCEQNGDAAPTTSAPSAPAPPRPNTLFLAIKEQADVLQASLEYREAVTSNPVEAEENVLERHRDISNEQIHTEEQIYNAEACMSEVHPQELPTNGYAEGGESQQSSLSISGIITRLLADSQKSCNQGDENFDYKTMLARACAHLDRPTAMSEENQKPCSQDPETDDIIQRELEKLPAAHLNRPSATSMGEQAGQDTPPVFSVIQKSCSQDDRDRLLDEPPAHLDRQSAMSMDQRIAHDTTPAFMVATFNSVSTEGNDPRSHFQYNIERIRKERHDDTSQKRLPHVIQRDLLTEENVHDEFESQLPSFGSFGYRSNLLGTESQKLWSQDRQNPNSQHLMNQEGRTDHGPQPDFGVAVSTAMSTEGHALGSQTEIWNERIRQEWQDFAGRAAYPEAPYRIPGEGQAQDEFGSLPSFDSFGDLSSLLRSDSQRPWSQDSQQAAMDQKKSANDNLDIKPDFAGQILDSQNSGTRPKS